MVSSTTARLSIAESLSMVKDRVSASCSIEKLAYMKVSGRVIRAVAEAWSDIQTETDTRATSSMANPTERVYTPGRTARCTRVSGPVASKKDRESGRASLAIAISENGASQKPQDMVSMLGKTVTDSKESGSTV